MISDTISRASIVNDNVKMLPITDEAITQWVIAIEEASHQSKHFNIEAFEKRNLEINTEAKKMQDFFLSL